MRGGPQSVANRIVVFAPRTPHLRLTMSQACDTLGNSCDGCFGSRSIGTFDRGMPQNVAGHGSMRIASGHPNRSIPLQRSNGGVRRVSNSNQPVTQGRVRYGAVQQQSPRGKGLRVHGTAIALGASQANALSPGSGSTGKAAGAGRQT
jgi:hypothetical protein